jgi:hypothetical protein
MKAFLLVLLFFFNSILVSNPKIKVTYNSCTGLPPKEAIECNVRMTLREQGIDSIVTELLVAQSKHESGNYTNNLTNFNNLFGRWHSKKDPYSQGPGAYGEGHYNFAKYKSIEDCVLSQLEYLRRKGYSFCWSNSHEYSVELKQKGYYAAPTSVYEKSLNKFLKTR